MRGRGAWRNGREITPSDRRELKGAVVGVDFKALGIAGLTERLIPILQEAGHLRHLGANALELCYVADGSIDAFIDLRGKLRTTDFAAAYLIVREAGGWFTAPTGEELDLPLSPQQRASFVASANSSLHRLILERLSGAGDALHPPGLG